MDLSCAQRNLQSRSATSRCACNSSAAPPVVSVRSASSVTGQPAPTAARCLHAPLRPRRCRRKGVVCAQADDLEVPQDNKSCGLISASMDGPICTLHQRTLQWFYARHPYCLRVVACCLTWCHAQAVVGTLWQCATWMRSQGINCYLAAGF